jgi:transcriptional regulator with XRE-family HTH domain
MMPAKFFARNPGSIGAVKTLADQVREFIEREGITATELARRCGVSRQNVDNVLKGSVKRVSWIAALAEAMHTTTDALLTGKPAAPRLVVRGASWPFEFLTREAWAELTPSQQAVVDHAAAKAAAEFKRGGDADGKRQIGA